MTVMTRISHFFIRRSKVPNIVLKSRLLELQDLVNYHRKPVSLVPRIHQETFALILVAMLDLTFLQGLIPRDMVEKEHSLRHQDLMICDTASLRLKIIADHRQLGERTLIDHDLRKLRTTTNPLCKTLFLLDPQRAITQEEAMLDGAVELRMVAEKISRVELREVGRRREENDPIAVEELLVEVVLAEAIEIWLIASPLPSVVHACAPVLGMHGDSE